MPAIEDKIRHQFKAREIDWKTAFHLLQTIGYASEDAQDMVAEWNAENIRANAAP